MADIIVCHKSDRCSWEVRNVYVQFLCGTKMRRKLQQPGNKARPCPEGRRIDSRVVNARKGWSHAFVLSTSAQMPPRSYNKKVRKCTSSGFIENSSQFRDIRIYGSVRRFR